MQIWADTLQQNQRLCDSHIRFGCTHQYFFRQPPSMLMQDYYRGARILLWADEQLP